MSSEIVSIVDDNDNIIGEMPRSEAHAGGYNVRIAAVIVFTSDNKIAVSTVSPNKNYCPGKLTYTAAGHVDIGEDYKTAAARELSEEIQISVKPEDLKFIGKIRSYDEKTGKQRHFHGIYTVIHDGPYIPDSNEISKLTLFSIDGLLSEAERNPEAFLPAFYNLIKSGKLFSD